METALSPRESNEGGCTLREFSSNRSSSFTRTTSIPIPDSDIKSTRGDFISRRVRDELGTFQRIVIVREVAAYRGKIAI